MQIFKDDETYLECQQISHILCTHSLDNTPRKLVSIDNPRLYPLTTHRYVLGKYMPVWIGLLPITRRHAIVSPPGKSHHSSFFICRTSRTPLAVKFAAETFLPWLANTKTVWEFIAITLSFIQLCKVEFPETLGTNGSGRLVLWVIRKFFLE